MEELLTPEEVAKELKVSLYTVRSWRFYGALPAVKVGRQVRFKREVIDRIANEGLDVTGIRTDT